MTTTSDEVTTKVASIIDHIAAAVAGSTNAEEAREALAKMVAEQDAKASASGAVKPKGAPEPGALVVDESVITLPNGLGYHVRKIGIHDDVATFRALRESGIPFMLYGPPGTGKTAGVEAAFASHDDMLHTVLGTGDTEVGDLIGSYVALPGGSFAWVDGPLIKAMEGGEPLFIDEIGLIDTKVLSILYSAMDGRGVLTVTANPERGTVVAKEGFYVCAATNPNAPGVRLSEALLSRFSQQILVKTDYSLAKTLGVDAKMVRAAKNMQAKVDSGELSYAPQLRELLAFKKIASILGEDVAVRNVISGAPEIDRPMVQDVLERTFGKGYSELEIE